MRRPPVATAAGLLVLLVLPGCIFFMDGPQEFPATYENRSTSTVILQIRIVNEDANRTSLANWTLARGQTMERDWRLVTHDSYRVNVTVRALDVVGPLASVEEWFGACALYDLSIVWDGVDLDLDIGRGDGFTGC
jgi:hypothetical protein